MKKRSIGSCFENRIQTLEHIKGGYHSFAKHWWPKRLTKYNLHVLEKFLIEKW